MGVMRRTPGSLLYNLHELIHVVFNVPVGLEGYIEDEIFSDMISKCLPVRCFCTEGRWTGLKNDSQMYSYDNWGVMRRQVETWLRM